MRGRARTWVAMAAVVTVVGVVGVVPFALDRDSFPLSTFPMFAAPVSPTEVVDTAVAVDPDGATERLGPQRLAGTDVVTLAATTVTHAIVAGQADRLCTEIAARVAASGPVAATAVEVVTEQYDAVAYFDGDRTPIERTVHARCAVPGR